MKTNLARPTICLLVVFFMLFTLVGTAPAAVEDTAKEKKETKKTEKKDKKKKDEPVHMYYEMTVTATSTEKDAFEVPKPVSVIDDKKIREKSPNNVTDLLPELPGVDVNGVGTNQSRPVIRGLRGQRILLMEDGIRINNSRRQRDFGGISSQVDVAQVERVEVVRGPASVLYGSDALGGVVNIITRFPDYDLQTTEVHGNLGYRYSSADNQNKGQASINGHLGRFGFNLSGSYRKSDEYTAPSGTFGGIDLAEDTLVKDTGVKDDSFSVLLNYSFTPKNRVSFKFEQYHAENAGFGFIEPDAYDPGSARIQIQYPWQKIQKYSLKYQDGDLGFALADHLAITGYHLRNKRDLLMNIFIPFNIPYLPGAGMELQSTNYTDVGTLGFRFELNKALKGHLFTYGVDFFNDSSENSDSSTTTMVGFGPPMPSVDNTPQVPNATYRSMGAFIQDEISLFKRTSLILGMRYQNVNARTKETPGLEGDTLVDSTDQTVVGAANLTVGISDGLRLVFSVGRGFRSPNLIERFFNGTTPEGSGFQSRNPDLKAETSLNVDVGFKYRSKNIYLESTFFNNVVYDGIRVAATGNTVFGMPEYQNINVDKLRMQGVEVLARLYLDFGLSLMANFTKIKSKDLGNPETPYVDTYSSKFNFNARYDHPKKIFWLGYDLRINGDQKDVLLVDNPIGDIIPGFTVHSVNAGITLFKNSNFPQRVGIVVGNLANTLYSEFSNASFFRPAPKRYVVLTWSTSF